jgi:DNA-binding response OmpR family regulator
MDAKCRILILDDNADAADSLGELLTLAGHDVRVCYAAVDALQMAAAFKPEVCILDIGLPEFDGLQLAQALRAMHGPGQVLIALSGRAVPDDIAKSRMAGFDHYVAKPAGLQELLELFPGADSKDERS